MRGPGGILRKKPEVGSSEVLPRAGACGVSLPAQIPALERGDHGRLSASDVRSRNNRRNLPRGNLSLGESRSRWLTPCSRRCIPQRLYKGNSGRCTDRLGSSRNHSRRHSPQRSRKYSGHKHNRGRCNFLRRCTLRLGHNRSRWLTPCSRRCSLRPWCRGNRYRCTLCPHNSHTGSRTGRLRCSTFPKERPPPASQWLQETTQIPGAYHASWSNLLLKLEFSFANEITCRLKPREGILLGGLFPPLAKEGEKSRTEKA